MNNFLFLADWSGQELRVLADYSSEEGLIRAFELGLDVHKLAAHAALGEAPTDEVEAKWWRNKGKEINFGTLYGIGDTNLAKRMKCTKEEAEKFKENYFRHYSRVKKFIDQVYSTIEKRLTISCKTHGEFCVDWCESEKIRRGWIKNIWGRRRYLTQNESYKGVNYLIQGTAADLMRSTNWKLYDKLKEYKTRIVLPIHDEFVFDMPYTEAREVIPIIVDTMTTCDKLKVPLKVDLKWAPVRWSESYSLSCDECDGNGKIFSLTEDERFDTLVKNDWDTLNSLTSEPCAECAGTGFNLKKIKGIK